MAMLKELRERILEEAIVVNETMVKVDGFLNHRLNIDLLEKMGHVFSDAFKNKKIDLILTIEASGIALAMMAAQELKVPVLFAKKGNNSLHQENIYTTVVHSATKNLDTRIYVSKDFIKQDMNVLIIDDFLAKGHAVLGLMNLVDQAHAHCVGVGIAIEKGFDTGGKQLREMGIDLVSCAIIEYIENGKVVLRDE